MRHYSKIQLLLIISAVLTSSFLFFGLGTRAIIACSAIIVLAILVINRQIVSDYIRHKPILLSLFFLNTLLATFLTEYHYHEFSPYQLLRSQFWFLLTPCLLFVGHHLYKNSSEIKMERFIDGVGLLLSISNILIILDIVFQLNFVPAYIKLVDQVSGLPRYYFLGLELALAFLPIFLLSDKRFYLCMALLAVFFTGGRTIFAVVAAVYFFYMFFDFRKLNVFALVALLFLSAGTYITTHKKINLNSITTDTRVSSGSIILKSSQTRPLEFFIGKGFGSPIYQKSIARDEHYSFLYQLSHPSENYNFDIENAFIFLYIHLGIIGTLLYILLIDFRYGRYTKFLWSILVILWCSMSPVGPSSCLLFFFLGTSAAIYNKIFNKLLITRL